MCEGEGGRIVEHFLELNYLVLTSGAEYECGIVREYECEGGGGFWNMSFF